MARDFTYLDGPPAHVRRWRDILEAHPEVGELMGRNRATALWVLGLVALQWATSAWIGQHGWIPIVLLAYCFGAFVNHALYVLIHECTHNLVFERSRYDKMLGIVCDFALVIPSAMAFRKYHLMHHKYLGQYALDPDIVRHEEGKLIGNTPLRKALWLALFSVSQALRPLQVTRVRFWDRWIAADLIAVVLVDAAVLLVLGPKALAYLALSTFFALGLHPLGGRWIQEHYLTSPGQETYSYYGILNKTCFNMGYHNEHHDFANVPWNNLPKLRRRAPEYYDSLHAYNSWTAVVWKFIFDPGMSSYSRIVHPPAEPQPA
jgi:sphingolipid delta-4 desaturase